MNRKGQFSIVAALFVAVILVATVIITYSTIRNSPVPEDPQLLSAVDETNFALKQVLGFTVGFYGSIMKVTGNSSYAKGLATSYLRSGLVNIGNMHPDWGASFNVTSSILNTYWYANSSYSKGALKVKYNLAGLGIHGISYEAACNLKVQIMRTSEPNKACLNVTSNGETPIINFGRSNFKFYRYKDSDSTWELVTPSNEPVAFANGTYLIDVPPGVNPDSYLIQVEDQRGVIVVASSFSRYSIDLDWISRSVENTAKYAVSGSDSAILDAPDGNYAEINKGGNCEVTQYEGGNWTITNVYFNITYYGSTTGAFEWYYNLDGSGWQKIEDLPQGGSEASPLTRTYDATDLRPTWTWNDLNSTSIQFNHVAATGDPIAYVDAIYVTVRSELEGGNMYSGLEDANIVVELLQNGTMHWLGQDLQFTTQAEPIPPVPVRSLRVTQTIRGTDEDVPFQVEDWTSEYQIPLGISSNASVFNNRNMLVFLANSDTSKVTIWWDGNDSSTQTPYAYVNRYFTGDDPDAGRLTNGIVTLQFGSGFTVTSTVGGSSCTANFMRINNEASVYGSSVAYAITGGIVRDVIHQEPEWSGGANNCPNLYAHVVLTLPANVTYYTYQLRLMFVDSQQTRTITDLCPIRLRASTGEQQTEDGTIDGLPIVSSSTGVFYNQSTSNWEHHWSQFISTTRGFGIMFTSEANQKLYAFDEMAGTNTGALTISRGFNSRTIELLPITMAPVSFQTALDITWHGAVVTFDGTEPIYTEESGNPTGLWVTVEHLPTITVTTES